MIQKQNFSELTIRKQKKNKVRKLQKRTIGRRLARVKAGVVAAAAVHFQFPAIPIKASTLAPNHISVVPPRPSFVNGYSKTAIMPGKSCPQAHPPCLSGFHCYPVNCVCFCRSSMAVVVSPAHRSLAVGQLTSCDLVWPGFSGWMMRYL